MTHLPLTPAQRRGLWLRLAIRGGLLTAVVLICWWGLPPLIGLLAPFVCALVAAAVLNPAVRGLQRRFGLGRGCFTLVVLGGVVAVLGGGLFALGWVAVGELSALVIGWESALAYLTDCLERIDLLLDAFWRGVPSGLEDWVDGLYDQLIFWLREMAPQLVERLASGAGQAVGGIPDFLLALLFFLMATYFLTADYPYLKSWWVSRVDGGLLHFFGAVRQTALTAFGGYLRAQLLLSVGVFFILLAGFSLIRQPYGMLIALGLAILDFIPILGAGTILVPWAFFALFSGTGGLDIMIIWGVVALFRRMAEPKFVGNQTGLSPVVSLISIYVGFRLAGVAGMIFGPIIALMVINLTALGVFCGFFEDISLAVLDISYFLQGGK